MTVRVKIAAALLIVLSVLAGAGLGSALYTRSQSIDELSVFSEELRDGLVENCERNGNPLRRAVTKMLRDDIEQSHSADLARFFPQIPPDELERLIARENRAKRETIGEIWPVDCEALYPAEP